MLTLPEIREWIVTLGIAEDENVYIGKLDNKKQKSVGVYGRASSGPPHEIPIEQSRQSGLAFN